MEKQRSLITSGARYVKNDFFENILKRIEIYYIGCGIDCLG